MRFRARLRITHVIVFLKYLLTQAFLVSVYLSVIRTDLLHCTLLVILEILLG